MEMFRRRERAPEPTGRYYAQTITSKLSSPEKHGHKVEEAVNQGTARGWKIAHMTSAPVSTVSVFTIIVWDTEA